MHPYPHKTAIVNCNVPPEIIQTAKKAADAAGLIIRRYFRQTVNVSFKDDESPVTKADKEAEAAVRHIITQKFPHHSIVGEEHGTTALDMTNDYVWVIDPIDGTKAFITGRPTFATLIAVAHKGEPVLGIIDQPISGERWIGVCGMQTTFNGTPVRTRTPPALSECILQATTPDMFIGFNSVLFRRLAKQVKSVVYGSDCYAYAMVASGCADLVVEADLKVWDYMALVPVVNGAGGCMGDWNGLSLGVESEGRVIAAGGAELFGQVSKIVYPADEMGLYPGKTKGAFVPDGMPDDPGEGNTESMTGFGIGIAQGSGYVVKVRVQSVNWRYREVEVKCVGYALDHRVELVAMVEKAVKRGKIIVSIETSREGNGGKILSVGVDKAVAKEVRAVLDEIAEACNVGKEASLSDVLSFPEILTRRGQSGEDEDAVVAVAQTALMKGIDEMKKSRRRAGALLEIEILQRTRKIRKILDDLAFRVPLLVEEQRERLNETVKGMKIKLDKERLESEIVLLADKVDLSEEVGRLGAHLQMFEMTFLGGTDEGIGQRVVMLVQEMEREITRLSEKCGNCAVTHLSVMIREEVEKIREQCVKIC